LTTDSLTYFVSVRLPPIRPGPKAVLLPGTLALPPERPHLSAVDLLKNLLSCDQHRSGIMRPLFSSVKWLARLRRPPPDRLAAFVARVTTMWIDARFIAGPALPPGPTCLGPELTAEVSVDQWLQEAQPSIIAADAWCRKRYAHSMQWTRAWRRKRYGDSTQWTRSPGPGDGCAGVRRGCRARCPKSAARCTGGRRQ